ncbi:MAG: UPF0175 family protein [Verrucomicrobiales bacterium]
MIVDLPDSEIEGTGLTSELAKVEISVALYRDRKLTLGRGASLAGLSTSAFLQEVGRRGVTINYDVEDLAHDLATLSELS